MPEPKKPATRSSGEHPAVQQYRAKMESISDEEGLTAGGLKELDAKLEGFLEESRSMAPPPSAVEVEVDPRTLSCEVNIYLSCVCILGSKGCNVAHALEDTKATHPMRRVTDLCEHGLPFIACPSCTPRA